MTEPSNWKSLEFDLFKLLPQERAAIIRLRQKVPRLSDREKIVFVVLILIHRYEPDAVQWVRCATATGFKPDFSSAVLEGVGLSWESKLLLAIEVLQGEKQNLDLSEH